MVSFLPTSERERELVAQGYQRVAGCDEAGRGPLAGPVFAAVVIWRADFDWSSVRDSKMLDELRRERLAERIEARLEWAVAQASVQEIDSMNILRATALAMQRAAAQIPQGCSYCLIDGRWPELPICPGEAVVRGDQQSQVIAAASILAKVHRDRWMRQAEERYPGWGLAQHKGYGTAQHLRALRDLGPSPLHRRSFAPVAQLQEC